LIIVAVKIIRQNQDNLRHMKYRNNFLFFTPPFLLPTVSRPVATFFIYSLAAYAFPKLIL
jgi:hypothetical protein